MNAAEKPRILVDARMVGPVGHGIGNYVQDIARALAHRERPYDLAFLIAPDCPVDSPLRRYECAVSRHRFLAPGEIFGLRREIAKLRPTLFHSPSFSSLWSYPCPTAFTVHDLNHIYFGGAFHRHYYRYLLLPAVRRARALATVSETAAAEIDLWLRNFGVKKEIRVVPNAILPAPEIPAARLPAGLERENYFLCLANAKPHKNLEFLKAAYRRAREKNPNLPPLALSVPGEDEPGIRHLGALPAPAIAPLLANARAFFFPSLYEGFGRPPVESALAGTAPVCSDIPVLREALAGVREAHFAPPTDQDAWADAFLKAADAKRPVSKESQRWIEETYSLLRVGDAADAFFRAALGR